MAEKATSEIFFLIFRATLSVTEDKKEAVWAYFRRKY